MMEISHKSGYQKEERSNVPLLGWREDGMIHIGRYTTYAEIKLKLTPPQWL